MLILHNSGLCKTTRCVCSTKTTAEKCLFMMSKRIRFLAPDSMDYCIVYKWVQFHTRERFGAPGELEGRNAPDTSNPTLLKDTVAEVVECRIRIWAVISVGGHNDLHVFHVRTLTVVRYRDEIHDKHVRPCAATINNHFIIMDVMRDLSKLYIFEDYLEDPVLENMER